MKEQILKLRAEGLSYKDICKKLECSLSSVSYHCGDGQKQKNKTRAQKRRGKQVIGQKIYHFTTKAIRNKSDDFQRRNKNKLDIRNITFKYKDVIEKFGEEPQCYLTGRKIKLEETKSYHFDHITPAAKGGSNELNNLGLACKEANKAKSDMTVDALLELCKEILKHNGYEVRRV